MTVENKFPETLQEAITYFANPDVSFEFIPFGSLAKWR